MTVAEAAERHRGELFGLAYRMLGSVTEAEDVVQETLLRLEEHGIEGIERPVAWLARVASRLCLDRLRSAQLRREVYVGPWLPEPVATIPDGATTVELAESVSMAFLLVLETLAPAERVAFLLHDVFGYGYPEIAAAIDRSEDACRQLVSRARKAVQARRPRFEADVDQRDAVAERFFAACTSGEVAPLLEVLAPDVTLRSDGGGLVSAARNLIEGPDRVARFLLGIFRQAPEDLTVSFERLNGTLGVVARQGEGSVDTVFVLDIADGAVVGLNAVRNPDKLRHL